MSSLGARVSESLAEEGERAYQLDILEEMEGESKLFFTFPIQYVQASAADCTA